LYWVREEEVGAFFDSANLKPTRICISGCDDDERDKRTHESSDLLLVGSDEIVVTDEKNPEWEMGSVENWGRARI
jgi:hypothetical protein